ESLDHAHMAPPGPVIKAVPIWSDFGTRFGSGDSACVRAGQRDFARTPSFSFLSDVTFAVFVAGRALNTVGSPVNGFVPSRALRAFTSFRLTLIKPGRMVTRSPLRTLSVTTSPSASRTAAAVRFSTPAP